MSATRTFTTCAHRDESKIVADILQGDADHGEHPYAIQWCRVCGAYRYVLNPHGPAPEGPDHQPKARQETQWRAPEGPDGQGIRFY